MINAEAATNATTSPGACYVNTRAGVWTLDSTRSSTIAALMKALHAATPLIERAHKDRKNSHLGNSYATLGSVFEACQPALLAHGIQILQRTEGGGMDSVTVSTELHHVDSGEWIRCSLRLTPVKADPQALGSAITYGRRYTLATLAGVLSEDDDGNAASGRAPAPAYVNRTVTKPAAPPAPPAAPTAAPAPAATTPAADLAARKAAALAVLEQHIGKEKAAEAIESVKKQHTNNTARLAALEQLAALYTQKA